MLRLNLFLFLILGILLVFAEASRKRRVKSPEKEATLNGHILVLWKEYRPEKGDSFGYSQNRPRPVYFHPVSSRLEEAWHMGLLPYKFIRKGHGRKNLQKQMTFVNLPSDSRMKASKEGIMLAIGSLEIEKGVAADKEEKHEETRKPHKKPKTTTPLPATLQEEEEHEHEETRKPHKKPKTTTPLPATLQEEEEHEHEETRKPPKKPKTTTPLPATLQVVEEHEHEETTKPPMNPKTTTPLPATPAIPTIPPKNTTPFTPEVNYFLLEKKGKKKMASRKHRRLSD